MTTPKLTPEPIRPSQLLPRGGPQEAAIEWIAAALKLEMPDETTDADMRERAEVLHAIAINWDVPIEVLIAWIHAPIAGMEWTGAEWRRWCTKYREQKRQIARDLAPPDTWPA